MNLYRILGLKETATEGEIRRAYRRAVRLSHPDYSGETDASRFREIQRAYEVLSDPTARKRYDQDRQETEDVPVRIDIRGGQRPRTQVREVYPSRTGTTMRRNPYIGRGRDPFEDLLDLMLRLF